jgi:hypothetical protein
MSLHKKPILTYFDAAGRAEAIRMLLVIAKEDFVDKRLTWEEFTAVKADLPSG